jgi:hypothetical protein
VYGTLLSNKIETRRKKKKKARPTRSRYYYFLELLARVDMPFLETYVYTVYITRHTGLRPEYTIIIFTSSSSTTSKLTI